MTKRTRTRRRFLYGLGIGGSVALAGCSEETDPRDGSDSDGGEGSDTDNGPGTDGIDTATHQVGRALSGPAWDPETRRGFCLLIADVNDVGWLFRDADAETQAFIEETDFGESVLAYAESIGPTTCDDELSFAEVSVEDGTLVASATVENTAGDQEACGEAITYPGALLRVTLDPLPDGIRLSITDGWGETVEVTGEDGVRDPDRLDGFVRPDDEPRSVPPSLDCDEDDFERHPSNHEGEVSWGSGSGVGGAGENQLELRVINPAYDGDDAAEALRFERGDDIRIEMTNISNREVGVGNHGKYNLEVYTEAGWTEVRGGDDLSRFVYTDELIGHPPGDGVEWEFTMTEEGLVAGGPHADVLRVCPDLQPGRYRFVFRGADDLAVAFDYVG